MNRTSRRMTIPFEERLLTVLLEALNEKSAAAETSRIGRRRRLARLTLAAAAALALGGSVLTSVAADRTIEVRADEALGDPRRLERELKAQGIDARIRAVPTVRSLVGKWFHLYFAPGVSVDLATFAVLQSQVGVVDLGVPEVEERCPNGEGCERGSTLELPVNLPGPLTLVVGRAPQPGEEYWTKNMDWGNELAPSGALYCYRLEVRPPSEAGKILENLGYEVRWVYEDEARSDPAPEPPPGSSITWAWFPEPGVVDIRLADAEHAETSRVSVGTPSRSHPRSSAPWAPTC